MAPARFTSAVRAVVVVGCLLAGVAPLVHTVSDVLTAAVQTGGALTAAFGGYAAVETLELLLRGTPLADSLIGYCRAFAAESNGPNGPEALLES